MFEKLNDLCLSIADPLLGWLMALPRDAALIIVALATGAILTFVRLFTTKQNLLHRCAADKKRIKELMKEAKKAGDKGALARYRATTGIIAMKTMKAELMPLLVSLVPIALLAVWAFARLSFEPPRGGDAVTLVGHFKASEVGRTVFVVPQPGLEAPEGWIRRIEEVEVGGIAGGEARWTLRAEARPEDPYKVEIRFGDATRQKELLVGAPVYAPTIEIYKGGKEPFEAAETELQEYKLFGVVPGIPQIYLAPWIVAYLLIAIPFVLLLRRVCGIR